ncbi:MAG: hypothetical protein WC007_09140 [Pelobacteraceae bacterium]
MAAVLSENEFAPEMETSNAPYEDSTVSGVPVDDVILGTPARAVVVLSTGVDSVNTGGLVVLKLTPAGGITVVAPGMMRATTGLVAPV